ncbi:MULTISPECIES: hypothetical protein [unclassified Actinotalea]|uniref:hypothetical protein n=1 Tax=unclassified Actinotalea TaxID=2638618 RepID=UPI0015F58500|nr:MULTISPECIES: hypothetical protein [unclassified Actinotalea]
MTEVLYTSRWNPLTGRPAMKHRWLPEDEARRAFESGSGIITIVDAATRGDGDVPRPRWVIGAGAKGRVRVQFFTPGGAVWRQIDYDDIDGRLWRWICITYVYPDDQTRYMRLQATRILTEEFRPDGTGRVKDDSKLEPNVDAYTLTNAPVGAFWMDRPDFGNWEGLTNPEYGVPSRCGR